MAEIAVNLVIDKLIPLLTYELTLQKEVHREVDFIKNQLVFIRAYLKDADVKAEREEKSNVVKGWVKQMMEVAHRIEDVIDEYLLHVAERRQKRGIAGVIEKIARLLRSIEPRHVIATEIRSINNDIDILDKRKETLGFIPTGAESSHSAAGHDLRRGALFVDDAKLVGINNTTKKLESLLLAEDRGRMVIGVVGTGGLGNIHKLIFYFKLHDFKFYITFSVQYLIIHKNMKFCTLI